MNRAVTGVTVPQLLRPEGTAVTLGTQASPILTGIPSVVAYCGLLAENGTRIMQKALEAAARNEVEHIRYEASKAPGWGEISEQIGVTVNKNHIAYTAPSKQMRREMKKLEYGSLDNAPVSVLRKQAKRIEERFSKDVETYIDEVVR